MQTYLHKRVRDDKRHLMRRVKNRKSNRTRRIDCEATTIRFHCHWLQASPAPSLLCIAVTDKIRQHHGWKSPAHYSVSCHCTDQIRSDQVISNRSNKIRSVEEDNKPLTRWLLPDSSPQWSIALGTSNRRKEILDRERVIGCSTDQFTECD